MHELPSNLIPVTGLSAGSLHLIPRTAPSHSRAKVGVLAACTLAETTALSATSSLPLVKPSNAETSPVFYIKTKLSTEGELTGLGH